jgi:hypothetical protein
MPANILATPARPNIWDAPVVRIKEALEQHLAAPAKWRRFQGRPDQTGSSAGAV